MARIDFAATINAVEFPDEIWGWLDLLGDVIRFTEVETLRREKGFVADSPYKSVLQGAIHSHLSGLRAVYALLRTELVSQAAGQTRLLCEGLISLQFVSEAPNERSVAFLDYATIEAFEAAEAFIKWEVATADPTPTAAVFALRDKLRSEYDVLRPRYRRVTTSGRVRPFHNWADKSIAQMADANPNTARLYGLIYRQLSAYVHGSAWSFRHLPAYTPANYDVNVVLADIAQVTLCTVAVWQAFAEFCERQLSWDLGPSIAEVTLAAHALSGVVRVKPVAPRSNS